MAECQLPPPGWWCSLEAGHEGSCPTRFRLRWWQLLLHSCDLPPVFDRDDDGTVGVCLECGQRWVAVYQEGSVAVTDGLLDCSTVEWVKIRRPRRRVQP